MRGKFRKCGPTTCAKRLPFVGLWVIASAFMVLVGSFLLSTAAHSFVTSDPVTTKFAQPLRGVNVIPVAAPDNGGAPVHFSSTYGAWDVLHYTININQFQDKLHPALGPTKLWGFHPAVPLQGPGFPQAHLGGIIIAEKGVPLQITFRNNLPPASIIPVDITIPGANQAQNRTSIHLHGGFIPWISDGGPFDWWAPNGTHGTSFLNNLVLRPANIGTNKAEYYYPNDQSARMVWYHDHAFGITRINAYAGVASGYIIRDQFERNLQPLGLPPFIETSATSGGTIPMLELPIVIQDKIFVPENIALVDPSWEGPSSPGSLWYAHTYDPTRWARKGILGKKPPEPSVIPEFFGDTMLVNGSVYPDASVQARRYRLRVLNACNARFLNLQLYEDDGTGNPEFSKPYNPPTSTGLAANSCLVLGTEGGFLPSPVDVPLNVPYNPSTLSGSLLMAPAERFDVIIDFTSYQGKRLILYNDAPAPFPIGDPANDHISSEPTGPDTRILMRFSVGPATGTDLPLVLRGADLRAGNDALFVPLGQTSVPVNTARGPVKRVRQLTLNETFDGYGRLIQTLGTNFPVGLKSFGRAYLDAATEEPRAGDIEVWQIANLTGDTHPIHFHLVNTQTISRRPFNAKTYNGTPAYTGPAVPPTPDEAGWKETVRMNPGEVTTVIMKFDLPEVPFTVPSSPRTGGNEYVWHCHILEHEEHDMMRPLVVR